MEELFVLFLILHCWQLVSKGWIKDFLKAEISETSIAPENSVMCNLCKIVININATILFEWNKLVNLITYLWIIRIIQ